MDRFASFAFGRLVLAIAPLSVFGALAAGCDSSESSSGPPAAPPVCPADIPSIFDASCVPGLLCAPEYTCGILSVTASCTCMGGKFACTDVTGQSLAVGVTPACPAAKETTATCPATEAMARTLGCSLTGQECTYPTSCALERHYDTCQCFPATLPDGGTALRFSCPDPCADASAAEAEDSGVADAPEEPSSPPVPEASIIDAPRESSATPPADAGSTADAKKD